MRTCRICAKPRVRVRCMVMRTSTVYGGHPSRCVNSPRAVRSAKSNIVVGTKQENVLLNALLLLFGRDDGKTGWFQLSR